MSDTTRRGFLGLLAHLPLVGAWLSQKAEKSEDFSYPIYLREWREAQKERAATERIIRWIPVSERLPEYRFAKHKILGPRLSEDVIAVLSDGTRMAGHLFLAAEGVNTWTVMRHGDWRQRNDVTHWAEFPSPPEIN